MSGDLTEEEMTKIALEIAKEGGDQGRAIVYRFCKWAEKTNPQMAIDIMESVIPRMPPKDGYITIRMLDEIHRVMKVDLRKFVADAGIKCDSESDLTNFAIPLACKGGEAGRAVISDLLISYIHEQNQTWIDYLMKEVIPLMPKDDGEMVHFTVSEYYKMVNFDVKKIVDDRLTSATKEAMFEVFGLKKK